jgi:hypothetical protein
MAPRYRVSLTSDERDKLERMNRTGKTSARQFQYARALLLCDVAEGQQAWTVERVAEALGAAPRTIEHLKKRFVEEGLEAALERKRPEKPPRGVTFDGAFEARLIALACSEAPDGHSRWTVRLLAEKAVELDLAPKVSHMTVQRILKRRTSASHPEVLEDSTEGKCGVRSQHGRCAGSLCLAVRPEVSGDLYG